MIDLFENTLILGCILFYTVIGANMKSSTLSRDVEQLVQGMATQDGDGVNLTRVLTQNLQRRLDPFLMLDAFHTDNPNDYIGGFPDHPHRGFETVTYMLHGKMRHFDNKGHEGLIEDGGVQWMTAARGLVHSEMPEQSNGLMSGFQLWINLPSSKKMIAPSYKDIPAKDIPVVTLSDGVIAKVIAGQVGETKGVIQKEDTEPLYVDVHLSAGKSYFFDIPVHHNAFLYVQEGSISVGSHKKLVPLHHMAILNNDDALNGVLVEAKTDAQFLLIAGKPLNESIAQWGPFVMNTEAEIHQAINDFRMGKM